MALFRVNASSSATFVDNMYPSRRDLVRFIQQYQFDCTSIVLVAAKGLNWKRCWYFCAKSKTPQRQSTLTLQITPGLCHFDKLFMGWFGDSGMHSLDGTSAYAYSTILAGIPGKRVSMNKSDGDNRGKHTLLQYLVRRHRLHLANWRVNSSHFPHL